MVIKLTDYGKKLYVLFVLFYARTQRSLLLSLVELKAASWLAIGDSSPSEQNDQLTSHSEPQDSAAAEAVQDVVEYSDDEDDVDYTDKNIEIV